MAIRGMFFSFLIGSLLDVRDRHRIQESDLERSCVCAVKSLDADREERIRNHNSLSLLFLPLLLFCVTLSHAMRRFVVVVL